MDSKLILLKSFLSESSFFEAMFIFLLKVFMFFLGGFLFLLPEIIAVYSVILFFNFFYITAFGAHGLKVLDRHFSTNPEKERRGLYEAVWRFTVYCFKYPLRLIKAKGLWVNLWMINNSVIFYIWFIAGIYRVLRIV